MGTYKDLSKKDRIIAIQEFKTLIQKIRRMNYENGLKALTELLNSLDIDILYEDVYEDKQTHIIDYDICINEYEYDDDIFDKIETDSSIKTTNLTIIFSFTMLYDGIENTHNEPQYNYVKKHWHLII